MFKIWGACLKSAVTLKDATVSGTILTPSSMCLRSRDPSATQPHGMHSVHFLHKNPPTTSGFQFPVSFGPPAWHSAVHFWKRPNNKHADPCGAEWHIFHRLWRAAVLRILLCIWNSLCTAKTSNWGAHGPLVDVTIRATPIVEERNVDQLFYSKEMWLSDWFWSPTPCLTNHTLPR